MTAPIALLLLNKELVICTEVEPCAMMQAPPPVLAMLLEKTVSSIVVLIGAMTNNPPPVSPALLPINWDLMRVILVSL